MSVDQRLDEEKSVILWSHTYLQGDFNITGGSRKDQNSAHLLIKTGLEEFSVSCFCHIFLMVLIKVRV